MTVRYVGIDDWNRPVFKGDNGHYYGNVDVLFSYGATEKEVLEKIKAKDLVYFGSEFNCEPWGGSPGTEIEIKEAA